MKPRKLNAKAGSRFDGLDLSAAVEHVQTVRPIAGDALRKRQAAKLAKLDAAIVRWARKQARAHRALAKLERSRKYYAAKVQS
jgi:hypothetical protein